MATPEIILILLSLNEKKARLFLNYLLLLLQIVVKGFTIYCPFSSSIYRVSAVICLAISWVSLNKFWNITDTVQRVK